MGAAFFRERSTMLRLGKHGSQDATRICSLNFIGMFCIVPTDEHAQIQPLNVVDVIAVLPFYLKLALEFSEIGVFGS